MRIKKVSETTPTQAQIVDGYSTSATDGYSARYINQAIGAGGETLKLGTILPFSGSTLPTGYLFCDGSAVSRTTYAGLFDVIGTTFGSGDGSTTFNLPNLKGKVPVGLDSNDTDFDTLGETGGEKTHTLTVNEMPSHTHKVRYVGNYANGIAGGQPGTSRDATPGYNELILAKEGGSQAHNNLQPYIVINYIIKASQTAPVQAQIVDGYSESTTDGYSANYVNNLNSCSSDEVQCGTWFGKKKYRKSYYISALANTGSTYTPLDITNLKEVISISGLASDGETFFPLPDYRGTQDVLGIQLYADIVNGIIITTGNDRTSYHANITIEYTKTTD